MDSRTLAKKYITVLQITDGEKKRYFVKCRNLALLYIGFSQKRTQTEVKGAAKAAFLSCAYDVCSDWREPKDFSPIFEVIMKAESPDLANIAIHLFQRDIAGKLKQDGLERGVVALIFIAKCMDVHDELDALIVGGIEKLGMLMQIVDDILDYKVDLASGDQNCLKSKKKEEYLQMLTTEFSNQRVNTIFPKASLLRFTVKRVTRKATKLATS